MNVIEILDESAAGMRAATAIAWGPPGREATLTFGALSDDSRRMATLFRDRGLRPGDGVVIALPMSGPLYVVMAAVLRSGMTAVFVDPSSWRGTLAEVMARLPVRGFVGTPMACALRWFTPILCRIPIAFVAGAALPGATCLRDAARCPPTERAEDCAPDSTALLTFTSGTTGSPKGVLRSHGMLAATQRILVRHLGLQRGQVHVALLPFFVFSHLGAGVTSVIPPIDVRSPAAVDPVALAAQIRSWNATGIAGSPFVMQRLADACNARGHALESLRTVFTGGAPVWPQVLDRIAAVAPNAEVGALYGATEAEPIALVRRGEWGIAERAAMAAGRGVLLGRPIEEIAVRVLADRWPSARPPCSSEDLAADGLGPGAEGEIVVSGPHVSRGYLRAEDNAANKIAVDGATWHRTGDAGYLDAQGRLWLVGRCAAKVATAGDVVYPLRVEAALSGVPGIARATLVESARRPILVIERAHPGPGTDLRAVASRIAWCGAEGVLEVRHVPTDRRHHAKVDARALREMLPAVGEPEPLSPSFRRLP